MTQLALVERTSIIGEIKRYSKNNLLNGFIERIYSSISPDDLRKFDSKYLFDMAEQGFKLIASERSKPYNVEFVRSPSDSQNAVFQIVNFDVPFLIDSLANELKGRQIDILLISHSMFAPEYNSKGEIVQIENGTERHYVIQLHILNRLSDEQIEDVIHKFKVILDAVNCAVLDWRKMCDKMRHAISDLTSNKFLLGNALLDESGQFLDWLVNNNFVFLGAVDVEYDAHQPIIEPLGIMKTDYYKIGEPPYMNEMAEEGMVLVRKWDMRSLIHRTAHMDVILVKKYREGKCIGFQIFLGLFTSTVYYQSVRHIPLVRKKVQAAVDKYGYPESSHNCKEFVTALESFPRGDLLQMSINELYDIATGIVQLTFTPKVKVFAREDKSKKFISFMIYIPEKRFSSETRDIIEGIISKILKGVISKRYVQFGEAALARLQLIVKLSGAKFTDNYVEEIEYKILQAVSVWSEDLYNALGKKYSKKLAASLYARYKDAFDPKYKAVLSGTKAVHDVRLIEEAIAKNGICFDVYVKTHENVKGQIHLKIYSIDNELPISSTLPIIENLGLFARDVHTYKLNLFMEGSGRRNAYIHHFTLDSKFANASITDHVCDQINETLINVWNKKIDNDEYNSLVIALGTDYRRANLFRAMVSYLKQVKYNLSHTFTLKVLLENIEITKKILELFEIKFSLEDKKTRQKAVDAQTESVQQMLNNVGGISEDMVLRSVFMLVCAVLRTNFYQKDQSGDYKTYLSLKVKSSNLLNVPQPVPYKEIYVFAPDFEAIHLRGGPVARGGLRWSDRLEDYRTEVLGLMKAQMTKNSVIVPVGSKGGFVLKGLHSSDDRAKIMEKGVTCYKLFLSGLLDITDNIVGGDVVPPKDVVRYDEDDPYLVVAADKGTATFSDYANQVSASYNFWLGDAFASGGSAGYDHKKMAITARGAWISVLKHFEEIGIDPISDSFTCVGIGDMAGDVFGNGLLLSDNFKLVAAFNHSHIFIDPNPDPKRSFAERKRLFNLPTSQWTDYDPKVLSNGAGIYSRKDKVITLSEEAQDALYLSKAQWGAEELMNAILKAPVDLLWNGGIGTYVKSKYEENERIGDKSNDNIRVTGEELGARVVGEGGNLGVTQLGRIEYAQKGGCINTDFIDNSAGVDCSDHEVNIKIALSDLLVKKKLKKDDRDKMLAKMTEDVAELVLRDNYEQTQIISIEQQAKLNKINSHAWLITHLESNNELDREIEFLPDDGTLRKMITDRGRLARPQIAVLLAYAKNSALKKVDATYLYEDKYLEKYLLGYFPKSFAKDYEKQIKTHRLKKEIISTVLVNLFINTLGITTFHQIMDESGASADQVIKAFVVVYEVFNIEHLWNSIETLDRVVPATTKFMLFNRLQMLIERNISWLLYHVKDIKDLGSQIEYFASDFRVMIKEHKNFLTQDIIDEMDGDYERYAGYKTLLPLLRELNTYRMLKSAFDVIYIAKHTKKQLLDVARVFYMIGDTLHLRWLISEARSFEPRQYLQILALRGLINEMHDIHSMLTEKECASPKRAANDLAILRLKDKQMQRFEKYIKELKEGDTSEVFVSKFTVAIKYIKELA